MRIAVVTNLYPPIQTGSSYWTLQAAKALVARGHHVVVITCGPNATGALEIVEGVRVYRLPSTLHFPRLQFFLNFDQFYLMRNRSNWNRMREILTGEAIEVIHQAGHLLDSALLSSRAQKELGLPVVCSIHTRIGHPTVAFYDFIMRTVDRFLLGPLVVRRFTWLMALDDVLLRHYVGLYRTTRIECVPVCVEDDVLTRSPAQPDRQAPVRIASVGHVTSMRDRRELLHAVAALRDRGCDVQLEIAGKELTTVTRELVGELGLQKSVRLLGELPRTAILDLFRESSIEAHWLDVQGVGSAGMEAMAMGLPVLAWGYEGIYGDVPMKHLENIIFVNPHDHQALVGTLERVVNDAALRARIGAAARETVERWLTWKSVAARLESVYERAIRLRAQAQHD